MRKARIGQHDILFVTAWRRPYLLSHVSSLPRQCFCSEGARCDALLSLSAVGSLREEIPPRSLVVPAQIIDRTVYRERSFFESGVVAHVGIADPFCARLRAALGEAAEQARRPAQRDGTYVCIEGRNSRRERSRIYTARGAPRSSA